MQEVMSDRGAMVTETFLAPELGLGKVPQAYRTARPQRWLRVRWTGEGTAVRERCAKSGAL